MYIRKSVKCPVNRTVLLWIAAAAVGTLILVAIGLALGLNGWIEPEELPKSGAVSAISQICADIGGLVAKHFKCNYCKYKL